jgi:hypothetical protein
VIRRLEIAVNASESRINGARHICPVDGAPMTEEPAGCRRTGRWQSDRASEAHKLESVSWQGVRGIEIEVASDQRRKAGYVPRGIGQHFFEL